MAKVPKVSAKPTFQYKSVMWMELIFILCVSGVTQRSLGMPFTNSPDFWDTSNLCLFAAVTAFSIAAAKAGSYALQRLMWKINNE